VKNQGKALSGPPGEAGKAVFANNGCGSCHTYAPAGATAKVGPDLDKLPAYAKQAGKPLEAFVKESIVDPNAYVQPGFPKGVMPPFDLPADQLDALVSYLTKGSK
jgi:cytochrome c551/c552